MLVLACASLVVKVAHCSSAERAVLKSRSGIVRHPSGHTFHLSCWSCGRGNCCCACVSPCGELLLTREQKLARFSQGRSNKSRMFPQSLEAHGVGSVPMSIFLPFLQCRRGLAMTWCGDDLGVCALVGTPVPLASPSDGPSCLCCCASSLSTFMPTGTGPKSCAVRSCMLLQHHRLHPGKCPRPR